MKRFHDKPILAWLDILPGSSMAERYLRRRELELFIEYEQALRQVAELQMKISMLRTSAMEEVYERRQSSEIVLAQAFALRTDPPPVCICGPSIPSHDPFTGKRFPHAVTCPWAPPEARKT